MNTLCEPNFGSCGTPNSTKSFKETVQAVMPMGPVSGLTMHCWGIGGPAGSGKHSWKTGDPSLVDGEFELDEFCRMRQEMKRRVTL